MLMSILKKLLHKVRNNIFVNVSVLGEVADFEALTFNLALNFI